MRMVSQANLDRVNILQLKTYASFKNNVQMFKALIKMHPQNTYKSKAHSLVYLHSTPS